MAEKYQRLKFDRELDAIEFTKEPHEYTFHPKTIGDNRPKMPKPSKENANEIEQSIDNRPESAPLKSNEN